MNESHVCPPCGPATTQYFPWLINRSALYKDQRLGPPLKLVESGIGALTENCFQFQNDGLTKRSSGEMSTDKDSLWRTLRRSFPLNQDRLEDKNCHSFSPKRSSAHLQLVFITFYHSPYYTTFYMVIFSMGASRCTHAEKP